LTSDGLDAFFATFSLFLFDFLMCFC
jgi:hypothetical protein